METFEEDDLADLLSDSDLDLDEPSRSTQLNFVDYDDEQESSQSNDDDDPFNIEYSSSENVDQMDTGESECDSNDSDIDKQIDDDANTLNQEVIEPNAEEQIDLDALYPWPQPHEDSFASRVVNIEKIAMSMNEKQILETLFHDIPSEHHPIDIRLFYNRHYLSDKNNTKYGFGQIIFANADTVEHIMPLLKQKQSNYNNKFRIFRKTFLLDIVTDHTVHHNLKDNTLRLVFVNLDWKCKALNIYQFIKNCLMKYKQNNTDLMVHVHKMLPIKIQIIEDDKGYPTGCAFVDFDDPLTVSTVLFASHGNTLMNKNIYVDFHPYPKRIKTWYKRQQILKKNNKTHTILISNLHSSITEMDIRSFITKHLRKIKNNNHDIIIKNIHLIHNRKNVLLCGYCSVCFVNKNDANKRDNVLDIMKELIQRIQYKVLQHRSVFVMYTRNKVLDDEQNNQKNVELKDKTRFVMMDNLVWDINQVNLSKFINENMDNESGLCDSVNIIVDRNGYPIGKALIQCASPEIATQLVCVLDGKLCRDRAVIMNWCNDREYKSIQSKHNDSFSNIMDFSSHFDVTQMKYLYDQLFGDHDFGDHAELKYRKRSNKKKHTMRDNRKNERMNDGFVAKNADIISKYNESVWKKRKNRKKIFQKARISMIDERMLREIKHGKTLQESRPKTLGEIRAIERKGKVGTWTKLGMSKAEMLHLKRKIDWSTGKSILSKVIASKRTIHIKDYWGDSLKHARRRNRNKWYIQATNKHNQNRKR